MKLDGKIIYTDNREEILTYGIYEIKKSFYQNSNIKQIILPNSVTAIGDRAFLDCKKLENISIPDTVTYIGYEAFGKCVSLKTLRIPRSVKFIAYNAFEACKNLKIIFDGVSSEWEKIYLTRRKISVEFKPKLKSFNGNDFSLQPVICNVGDTLYIYKTKTYCHNKNHNIVSATGLLIGKNNSQINLNVEYCRDCNVFYMNYISYNRYKEIYGIMLGNLKIYSNNLYEDDKINLADESPLSLCGYTVNQKEGLSEYDRHNIISNIIDAGILKKQEIVHYLEHFIRMNGKKKGNEIALSKWKVDLDFTLKYNMDLQNRYYISDIKKYGKSNK